MVVASEETSRDAVATALRESPGIEEKLIGVVLNKAAGEFDHRYHEVASGSRGLRGKTTKKVPHGVGIEQRMRWRRAAAAPAGACLPAHPRHRHPEPGGAARFLPASATDALGRVNSVRPRCRCSPAASNSSWVAAAAFEAGVAYHMIVFGSLPSCGRLLRRDAVPGRPLRRAQRARAGLLDQGLQDPKEQLRRVFRHWNVAFRSSCWPCS